MHPIPARQRVRRQPLELPIPADLLEQLHSRSHPFCSPPARLGEASKVEPRSDGSGAKSSVRTGAKSGVRGHLFRNLPPVALRGSAPDQPTTAADHRLAAPAREVPRRATPEPPGRRDRRRRHRVMRGRKTRASAFVAIGPLPTRGRRLPDPHGQNGSATSGLRSGRPGAARRRRRRAPARPAVAAVGASTAGDSSRPKGIAQKSAAGARRHFCCHESAAVSAALTRSKQAAALGAIQKPDPQSQTDSGPVMTALSGDTR